MAKVPNPNRCYLGPSELRLLGLEEEYAAAARRRAAQKQSERDREEREAPRESRRIA